MQYALTEWYYHVHFGVCFQNRGFIIENSRTSSTHLIRVKKTHGYPTITKIYNSFLLIHTHFRKFLKDTLFSHLPIMCFCHCLFMKSCWLFTTSWPVAHQAPLSMGFPRQEYWSGLLFPFPGDLPDQGIKPKSSVWQANCLSLNHLESPSLEKRQTAALCKIYQTW